MKKEDFVAYYILAGVGLTTTENAIWVAQDAWQVYEEWLAKQPPQHDANTLKLKKK